MIYRIYSSYRITNLLSTKNFVIASQDNPGEYISIDPMSQINFDFFHKGKNTPLLFSVNNLSNNNFNNEINNFSKFTSNFKLNDIGTYTFIIAENMFNLEIRKSSKKDILDVFVVETNLDNGKIIIDNLTNNIINICQKNYGPLNQIIRGNEKQILNIYDQNCMEFFLKIGGDSQGRFEFIPSKIKQEKIDMGNNVVMCLESNGIKM